jgi:hypothetical protein
MAMAMLSVVNPLGEDEKEDAAANWAKRASKVWS